MKAIIKIVSAGSFNEDQKQIIRRVVNVLMEHHLSVAIIQKIKKVEVPKFKIKVS